MENYNVETRLTRKNKSPKLVERNLEDDHDRFNDLPDSLLIHILSFLRMKDVITTCFLSRRWRYLWTTIPVMDFRGWPSRSDKVGIIDRGLLLHEGLNIQKLCLSLYYHELYSLQLDSWIRFAVRRNVQELDLDLTSNNPHAYDLDPEYKLPRCIFCCRTLKVLALKLCVFKLPALVHLKSLTTLHLEKVDLGEDAVEILTLGFPLLEEFSLVDCIIPSVLKIHGHLRSLKLTAFDNYLEYSVQIYAPKLVSLEIFNLKEGIKYFLKDVSSLAKVYIHFEEVDAADMYYEYFPYELKELLDDLRHVKALELCSWCLEMLSKREIQKLDVASSNATCLELVTHLNKKQLPGFAHLLRGSRYLETLIININTEDRTYRIDSIPLRKYLEGPCIFNNKKFWLELSSSCSFEHLKTIKILGFMGGDSYLEEEGSKGMQDFLKPRHNQIELVKFLLKSSMALEKMTISITRCELLCKRTQKIELLTMLNHKICHLPRASPNAVVLLTSTWSFAG